MEAHLERSNFFSASLEGANFQWAHIGDGRFAFARLYGANLQAAHIEGAHLGAANGLTQAQINSAVGDWRTELPAELTRPAHWDDPKLRP